MAGTLCLTPVEISGRTPDRGPQDGLHLHPGPYAVIREMARMARMRGHDK
jgi:hypothetical protein